MSRVATNYPTPHYNNGVGQSTTGFLSRSSSTTSNANSIGNGSHAVTVRSAAPPPVQKETVHACPICNGQYKDPRVLPCAHTYCLSCIRDKLINNNQVICPKCHHQVHPFDETDLNDLPRNLILSQEWRLNARPVPSTPTPKKPVTHQSIVSTSTQMPKQQDRRKSSVTESNGHDSSTHSHGGIAAIVNAFNKSTGNRSRSSRSSSVTSGQPVVSNLVRIYTEATAPKQQQQQQQQQKTRSDSVVSTTKHDELTKIFEQVTNRSQRSLTSSASIIKRPSQAYEEITWDSLAHGTTPIAPPFPDQWQTATEHHHLPPEAPERPISAASSDRHSNVDNLHDIISTINQYSHEKTSPLFRQGSIRDSQIHSRPSTASRSQDDSDEDENPRTSVQHPLYATIQPQQYHHQGSYADSVHSDSSSSTSRQSPVPPIINNYQQKLSSASVDQQQQDEKLSYHTPSVVSTSRQSPVQPIINSYQQKLSLTSVPQQQHDEKMSYHTPSVVSTARQSPVQPIINNYQQKLSLTSVPQQQNDEKMSYHTPSAVSTSRRSSNNFPLPPPNIETLDLTVDGINKPRSGSSISTRSSAYVDANETHLLSTERFNPKIDIPPPIHPNNSTRAHSQTSSRSSTPTNRPVSKPIERNTQYLFPNPSSSLTTAVTTRVDYLLSDQKRLEHEIEDQIKSLKYDYDDVRKQIDRKQSSIHNEVKNIAAHLDQDITEHYHRKQKIYADLAADTNSVGTELERLKSHSNNNNKQQLWANLEQIELNIRNIRQAVEQQKEPRSALKFSEGHRTIGSDTIGQITYTEIESQQRFNSSPPKLPPPLSSFQTEQTSTNITPYKYIKIDHLAALEPEAIAITENNKKILLGICNKLFILDEHGSTINIIPLAPSIRGIAVSKKHHLQNLAYVSHDETVSIVDIDTGKTIDCVKETDSTGESGTFLPLGIDTDNIRGDVYVCDYRNSCVIKFDDKLEFITQWRIYNHSNQYDEARPKLISVYGQRFYMIVEHSCKPYYNQGIAYTFSLHICDTNSGNIIKIIDADLLSTQRLRWPCSVQAINNDKCYILDTMTSGKYFNGQWQKHWSRVLEIGQDESNIVTELFQLDSEAATMAMTKQIMIIAANGDILFVNLAFLNQQKNDSEHEYQNLP